MNLKIIRNFFDKEDLDYISSIKLSKKVEDKQSIIYHNKITKEGKIESELLDHKFLKSLQNKYHPIAIKLLKELCPQKVDLYEYSDFSIIKTGKNSTFPIHDDTPNKLLSGVIYLYPNKNTGTIFYSDKKGKLPKIINWKQNTGVFFSRIERTSWHSYQGDGKSDRVALVYNLMTTKIKEVYRIEKKNYFYGLLRWKLNPHLYNYLKIFI